MDWIPFRRWRTLELRFKYENRYSSHFIILIWFLSDRSAKFHPSTALSSIAILLLLCFVDTHISDLHAANTHTQFGWCTHLSLYLYIYYCANFQCHCFTLISSGPLPLQSKQIRINNNYRNEKWNEEWDSIRISFNVKLLNKVHGLFYLNVELSVCKASREAKKKLDSDKTEEDDWEISSEIDR